MSRRDAERRGHDSETLAAWWLRLKGFRILARRYRTPVGEIDLVAERGRLIVFVEVKRRPTLAAALSALAPGQQLRITRAAEHFLARRQPPPDRSFRFDVIALAPGHLPRHVVDAWRA